MPACMLVGSVIVGYLCVIISYQWVLKIVVEDISSTVGD